MGSICNEWMKWWPCWWWYRMFFFNGGQELFCVCTQMIGKKVICLFRFWITQKLPSISYSKLTKFCPLGTFVVLPYWLQKNCFGTALLITAWALRSIHLVLVCPWVGPMSEMASLINIKQKFTNWSESWLQIMSLPYCWMYEYSLTLPQTMDWNGAWEHEGNSMDHTRAWMTTTT